MYSPHSPPLSSGGHTQLNSTASIVGTPNNSPRAYHPASHQQQQQQHSGLSSNGFSSAYNSLNYQQSTQCLKFKYFATFFVCTTCLALLSASLATHKWLVSKPIRVLKLSGQQHSNFSALMLSAAAQADDNYQVAPSPRASQSRHQVARLMSIAQQQQQQQQPPQKQQTASQQVANLFASTAGASGGGSDLQQALDLSSVGQQFFLGNKFQGEIYFGLFNGVKVLNYGFGDRVSQLSVLQPFFAQQANKEATATQHTVHELVNFKFWLVTLIGVVLAIIFALIGSIFAIVNFVMTPRGTLSGPVGLVIWNALACFACLTAIFSWLIEYYLRLKSNVLTHEEVLNGWISENRSQFGYSYYLVVLAFVLHLVNIFIVSLVQFETWTSQKASKRHLHSSRHSSACEGVIMLY